jgi:hypothetical protein
MQYRTLGIAGEKGRLMDCTVMLLLRKQHIRLLEIRMMDLPMNFARQGILLVETLLKRPIDRGTVGQAIQRIVAV